MEPKDKAQEIENEALEPETESVDQEAMEAEAFDKGVEEANTEQGADAPESPEETPEPDKAPAEKPAEAKPKPDMTSHDKAVETEIKERGLKEDAATRFRELANAANAYTPIREAMDKAGITADKLPEALNAAVQQTEWREIIADSTAQPEQLSDALNVIKAINSDDPAVLGQVYDKLAAELEQVGKRIGREVPGRYDPLSEHADLSEAVEAGDMTRKHAAEVAQARAQQATRRQRQEQQGQQAQAQQATQQAQQEALKEVAALNTQLKTEDAANFAHRMQQIDYAAIRQLPPHLWAAKVEAAYWRVQPAAPAKPAIGHVPLRANGGGQMQRKPQNDVEAFDIGVASVR